MPILICKTCNKTFRCCQSKIADGKGKYCSNDCRQKGMVGKGNPNWKGGMRGKSEHVYKQIYAPSHSHAGYNLAIPYHRFVVENILGRTLKSRETIHHIDFNIQNNAPSNLFLFPSNAAHVRYHHNYRRGKERLLVSNLPKNTVSPNC
jgi:hypothetical protein